YGVRCGGVDGECGVAAAVGWLGWCESGVEVAAMVMLVAYGGEESGDVAVVGWLGTRRSSKVVAWRRVKRPNWDATDYFFKEDYTIVPKPRAIIYKDRNDQRKLMRLNEIHKFSDGTLTRVMEKLDHMVKDFHLFEYNKGMETRKWSEDDKRRSKDFITAIEKRLQIRRIFRSLESFVGGRIRDIDYRLINRTT
ncbi:hypothetical protein Tco_0905201, partial [Tanacetum coccineum]